MIEARVDQKKSNTTLAAVTAKLSEKSFTPVRPNSQLDTWKERAGCSVDGLRAEVSVAMQRCFQSSRPKSAASFFDFEPLPSRYIRYSSRKPIFHRLIFCRTEKLATVIVNFYLKIYLSPTFKTKFKICSEYCRSRRSNNQKYWQQ